MASAPAPTIRAILEPYRAAGMAISVEGNGARVPFGSVSVIGLVLHELAANATRFGAWSEGAEGQVSVDWQREGGNVVLTWIETGGPEVSGPPAQSGTGSTIMDRMIAAARGTIDRQWKPEGLHAVLTVPIEGGRV